MTAFLASEAFCGPFYGLLTAATVVVARRGYHASPRYLYYLPGAAYLLATVFVLSNLSYLFAVPHMKFYPLIDAFCATILSIQWAKSRHSYLAWLAGLFMLDGVAHFAYFNFGADTYHDRFFYDLALNLIYVAQMAAVVIPAIRILRFMEKKS